MGIASDVAKKYPSKAADAARSCEAVGSPIVSRNANGEVVSVHQKYRLGDGTVVPMDYVEPAPVPKPADVIPAAKKTAA